MTDDSSKPKKLSLSGSKLTLGNIDASKLRAGKQKMQWIWDEPDYRFLDGTALGAKKVGFTSYPRSGNSFLRRYCEQVTSLTTGSSMHTHTSTSL